MRNIPTLKAHLQEEWDKVARKAKAKSASSKNRSIEESNDDTAADHIERDNDKADKPEQETV
jgi:hypothetical protein